MRISKDHANIRYQNLSSIFSRVPGVKESSAMGAPVLIFSMVAVFNDLPSMAVFSGVWAQGPWWRRESWISLLHAALSISHSFGYWKAKCSWQIIVDKRPWKTSSFPMKLRQNWWQNVWIDKHFSYFDWNSAKKLQKVIFYFHWTVKRAFMFWTTTQREMHKSKKPQHVDLLTSTY